MADEIWMPITISEFIGFYEISNLGRVKRLERATNTGMGRTQIFPEIILKTAAGNHGYQCVGFQVNKVNKRFLVHRLVALHFIPNPDSLPVINHIDGNKQNNSAINLEWCTYSSNAFHAYRNGLRKGAWTGKFNKDHHLTKAVSQFTRNHELVKRWESSRLAAENLSILRQGIVDSASGRKPHYKGFIWKYE